MELINDTFELRQYRDFIKQYNLSDEIEFVEEDEFGEKLYKVKDIVFSELQRTYSIFTNGDQASERIDSAMKYYEDIVKDYVKSIGVDAIVKADMDEVHGYYAITVDIEYNGDVLTLEPEGAFYPDEDSDIEEAANSWSWAAWLGVDGSPLFSYEFLDAYEYDRMSQYFEQGPDNEDWLEDLKDKILTFFDM